MTLRDFGEQISAFLSTPLGTLVMIVLAGVATYVASVLKAKGAIAKQSEINKVEEAARQAKIRAEAENAANEREQQNIQDREAIRRLMVEGQTRINNLQRDLDAINREMQAARNREAEQQAAHARLEQALQETLENLANAQKENQANLETFKRLEGNISNLETDRKAALDLVKQKSEELVDRERTNAAQAEEINGLKKKLGETVEELERVKARLDELEKKETGNLEGTASQQAVEDAAKAAKEDTT